LANRAGGRAKTYGTACKSMMIILNTDGASRGNPGAAAVGGVALSNGEMFLEFSETIGETTNNDAEYQALIMGLKKIKSHVGKKKAKSMKIEARLDSELAVKQLNHEYKITNELLQKHFIELWNLMLDFGGVEVVHVPREENERADELANKALDQGSFL